MKYEGLYNLKILNENIEDIIIILIKNIYIL